MSLLRPHVAGGTSGSPPDPIEVAGELEYTVEKIIRHRYPASRREYLVRWLGYDTSEDTWLRAEDLEHAQDILRDFQRAARLTR